MEESSSSMQTRSLDPFDPASCTGTQLTVDELAALRNVGLKENLGRYQFVSKYRICKNPDTGPYECGEWQDGTGDLAQDVELRGDLTLQTTGYEFPRYFLRFLADVTCGPDGDPAAIRNYGMGASSSIYPGKKLEGGNYYVPRGYDWSERRMDCSHKEMFWRSETGVLTDHCLRLEGYSWGNVDALGRIRRENKLVLLNQF